MTLSRRAERAGRPDLAAELEHREGVPTNGQPVETRAVRSRVKTQAEVDEEARQWAQDLYDRISRDEARKEEGRERIQYARAGVLLPPNTYPALFRNADTVATPSSPSPRIEVREDDTYAGKDPNVSWVLDALALRSSPWGGLGAIGPRGGAPALGRRPLPSLDEASQRQHHYLEDIGRELRGRTAAGERYKRILSDYYRAEHGTAYDLSGAAFADLVFNEFRSSSSASNSLGAFAPPIYMLQEFAAARAFGPVGAQSQGATLPATGMQFSVPVLTLGYASGVQAGDNTNILQISPTSQYVVANVQTSARGLELSQQLLDRSGLEIDRIVARQAGLHAAVDIDVATIAAVTAVAATITNNGTAGITTLLGDVAKAAAGFTGSDGTALPATHAFLPSPLMKYYQSLIGSDSRPVFGPSPAATLARSGQVGGGQEGYTGYDVAGAQLFEDNHLPTTNSGADATVLVGDFRDGLLVATAEPVIDIFPEFNPAAMTAIARHRQYFGVAVLYPSAFAQLTGSAYPASPSFA